MYSEQGDEAATQSIATGNAFYVKPMHDLIPLTQLPSGTKGSVSAVLGLPDVVHRLEELGLRQGTVVEMVQPGSPCIVRLSGNKLCFRADELLTVLVEPETEV